jgi:hypothetical protein
LFPKKIIVGIVGGRKKSGPLLPLFGRIIIEGGGYRAQGKKGILTAESTEHAEEEISPVSAISAVNL